jgi:hypothetical protein
VYFIVIARNELRQDIPSDSESIQPFCSPRFFTDFRPQIAQGDFMNHITLSFKLGLPTLVAIIPDLVNNNTQQTSAVAELIVTDGGLFARTSPTGEKMSYQRFHHDDDSLSAVMPLRKWLSCALRATLISALVISGCSSKDSVEDLGGQGKLKQQEQASGDTKPLHKEVGKASWYGPGFQGQETANGETFNQKEMTAAHPTLPMGTEAKVTNLENGKKVEVRINDRGPYAENRVIDVSGAAANKLDMKKDGTTQVKIETKPSKKKHTTKHSSKTK